MNFWSGVILTAVITPLLNKPTADPSTLNNLRPISNLPFISKILEQTLADQVYAYLSDNNLLEELQSGFHSPHTVALRQLWLKSQMICYWQLIPEL